MLLAHSLTQLQLADQHSGYFASGCLHNLLPVNCWLHFEQYRDGSFT